ncbi:MAG: hypothetical protein IJF49_06885 [Clostridia bacterium]|nr:hypothetical protein [Clostridia bacterium]
MKIKTLRRTYAEVMAMPRPTHRKPMRPSLLLSSLIRVISIPELMHTQFRYTTERMDAVGNTPCLILMNHSSFIDLKIAFRIFYPKPLSIVCTSDGFVGKPWLMHWLGCIPTQKFISDPVLLKDMRHALFCRHSNVLMFPEASYSFNGCATPLPQKFGILLKHLKVPVVTIHADGAFSYDPLYNNLQKRKVPVSAHVRCLLTPEEIESLSVAEIDDLLQKEFTFDHFAWQKANGLEINESFRADGLNRILYQCSACGTEGKMEGQGTTLTCHHCGKRHELTPLGELRALDGEETFTHIPDWYAWQREQIAAAVADGSYRLDTEVEIGMMVDYRAIYMVGEGRLIHDRDGFRLTGCDGQLDYHHSPLASHSLYSDYFWYELGDIICIGDRDCLYYCFPRQKDVVARTRIAAEEIYHAQRARRRSSAAGEKALLPSR